MWMWGGALKGSGTQAEVPVVWTPMLGLMLVGFVNWDIFGSVTALKPWKMRVLETPVNKALPTKNYFCDLLYTIRCTL